MMGDDESPKELYRRAWKHIDAQEFAEAETPLRRLIDSTDPDDPMRLWELHGLLAGVLNSLSRTAEGTDMYRRALAEARRGGDDRSAVGPARYMLANQYLLFGDPRDALAEATPVPAGAGHVQCLLHSIAAQALWKLGRRDEPESPRNKRWTRRRLKTAERTRRGISRIFWAPANMVSQRSIILLRFARANARR